MDKQELISLCKTFKSPDRESFSKIVTGATENGFSEADLSLKFACAVSTVKAWKSGRAEPHPRVQSYIVHWIDNKLK